MARIAFLLDSEYEDSEFQGPFDALRAEGHDCRVVGLLEGTHLVGKRGESKVVVDEGVDLADPLGFDALVIPGGNSPDRLRAQPGPAGFVRSFVIREAPIAAICHGPQLLIDAEALTGRTVTSWPSVRADLENAGATWVDRPVVEDGNLITSRKPDDAPAFVAAIKRRLAAAAVPPTA